MRLIGSSIILSILATLCSAQAGDVQYERAGESEVFALSEKTFDTFLAQHNVTLVEYFAPWCGHCQRLEPEYKKAAEKLKENGINLAHVNCVDNEKLCQAQQIRGYPTLKIFNSGKEVEYDGPRDAEGIVKFMKKQIMPAVSKINLNELDTITKNDDVVVVGVFPEGSNEEAEFKKVAEEMKKDLVFASIKPGVYMMKKFDDGFAAYDSSAGDLKTWIKKESFPLMAEVSRENYIKYVESGLPMAYLFYTDAAMRKEYGGIVEEVVKKYKGKLNAVYINGSDFSAHAKQLLVPEPMPGFVIHDMEGDFKYPFTGKLNKEELGKFVDSFAAGTMEPTLRSEDIPEKNDTPVKVVVSKSFEKVVLDPSKDVLLELYAPWCGACKRLADTYDALGRTYAPHSDKIVIAKMDGTANDLPKSAGVKLTKFPTFVFYKAGSNQEPIEFERAGESVQTFVDFISKHATNKVEPKIVEVNKDAPKEKEEL